LKHFLHTPYLQIQQSESEDLHFIHFLLPQILQMQFLWKLPHLEQDPCFSSLLYFLLISLWFMLTFLFLCKNILLRISQRQYINVLFLHKQTCFLQRPQIFLKVLSLVMQETHEDFPNLGLQSLHSEKDL